MGIINYLDFSSLPRNNQVLFISQLYGFNYWNDTINSPVHSLNIISSHMADSEEPKFSSDLSTQIDGINIYWWEEEQTK